MVTGGTVYFDVAFHRRAAYAYTLGNTSYDQAIIVVAFVVGVGIS